jgi:hypothetical protein
MLTSAHDGMKVDVAIISAGEDRQTAARLARQLKAWEIDVWTDLDALVTGITPVRSVEEALASCRVVLYLCSQATFARYFHAETNRVAQPPRDPRDPIVILVRVEDCNIPTELLYRAEQTVDLRCFTEDTERLALLLKDKLSRRLVFICHSHRDKPTVDRIVANLQTSPELELWYDATALQPGAVIRRGIEGGIARAHYLLAVMSRHAIDRIDGWIGFELDQAYEKEREYNRVGHHFVVPVLIDKRVTLPGWLSTKVWVDLTEDFDSQLDRLRRSLCLPFPRRIRG